MDSSDSKSQDGSKKRLSTYTLRTIPDTQADERSSLNGSIKAPVSNYGAVPPTPEDERPLNNAAIKRRLIIAGLKMALVFVVSTALLAGVLYLALPTLDDEDRDLLHVPRSFEQLQQLNTLLKKYRSLYPYRIVLCFVITYLFLQAFSLPGSMYMSILAGAVWGPARAIPLCCTCVASGATLCYFIGAALGPALLALPTWKARLDKWATKIDSQRANLISFLIVIRIAPFPPHWVVNVLCPHVGIGLVPFFVSTWLGILGVTVIHTTIGGGLDQMTSAADFHLISWKNFLGLSAVVVAVLIPVGIRWYFRGEIESVAAVEAAASADAADEEESMASGAKDMKGKGLAQDGTIVLLRGSVPEALSQANGVRHPLAAEWKGKGVERDWLYDEEDLLSDSEFDDEPLPPPPNHADRTSSPSSSSSSSLNRDKAKLPNSNSDDVKQLG
ncbi:hypothetical protein FRC03_006712 [Tulasnella sp. 419]|nr:hypothetical protein FRC03_006712 [Tulasnella sp. 419]